MTIDNDVREALVDRQEQIDMFKEVKVLEVDYVRMVSENHPFG